MSDTEVFMILILVAYVVWSVFAVRWALREGWQHGYGEGYDDRDAETLHGESPGRRDKRNPRINHIQEEA